jgi:ABC-type enterochelin transport system permease subunit
MPTESYLNNYILLAAVKNLFWNTYKNQQILMEYILLELCNIVRTEFVITNVISEKNLLEQM